MRRLLYMVLPILLVIQMYSPIYAFAASTSHNTPHENLSILDRLQGMYGNDLTEMDVLNELYQLGLLDNNGELIISDTIMVDNSPMTLEQVRIMLQTEGVDLQKKVIVDGASITLGDLKVMLEIEQELERLRATYLTGIPFTEAHRISYSNLVEQLTEGGITIQGALDGVQGSSMIPINHDARIRIHASATEFSNRSTDAAINLWFTLVDRNGNEIVGGLGYDVGFDWHAVDGSAKRDEHYTVQPNGGGFVGEGTVTIPKGKSKVQAVAAVRLPLLTTAAYNRWAGDKVFYIQAENPVNTLFEGDKRSQSIPILLRNDYAWKQSVREEYSRVDGSPYGTRANTPSIILPNIHDRGLEIAVQDIFGGIEDASFLLSSTIQLEEGGSFNTRSYTMTAFPMLKDEQGEQIFNAEYSDQLIGAYTMHGVQQQVLTIHSKSENKGSSSHYVKFSGAWPGFYDLTNPQYAPPYNEEFINLFGWTLQFDIIDKKAPSVHTITAPAGSYYSGQTIPIAVEFSEPVRITPSMTMQLQGVGSLEPVEADGTLSKHATYVYTVPANPNQQLIVASITNITDMANNTTANWSHSDGLYALPNVAMTTDQRAAFIGLVLENEPSDGVYANDGTIAVRLNIDTQYSAWLEQPEHFDSGTKKLKTVYVKAGGYTFPLTAGGVGASEGSFYTTTIPAILYELMGGKLSIELYTGGVYQDATVDGYGNIIPAYFSGGSVVIGKAAETQIRAVTLVESIQLDTSSYPDNGVILMFGDTVTLGATVTPQDATYPAINWISSAGNIAQIDPDTGAIRPIAAGPVSFSAIVANNGYGEMVMATTPMFTVKNDGPSTIAFQKGRDAFYAKQNEGVHVYWNQNLTGKVVGTSVDFQVDIYKGHYASTAAITGAPIHTTTIANASEYYVPPGVVEAISTEGNPAYTIKVSARDPENASVTLSAIGYIIVYPQPVKVAFQKWNFYDVTDDISDVNIAWSITNLVQGTKELTIYKNNTLVYQGAPTSNSLTLPIQAVAANALKDTYTVMLRAKNDTDSNWSTDSFSFRVYNRNALHILVEGQVASAVTMDNNNFIRTLYESGGSQAILKLGRDIYLKRMISINYGEHAWGNLTDQIQWAASNSRIASVNYRQGTLYENIERFHYDNYRPFTEFMLAGHTDGTSRITVTHVATLMEATLDAAVTTLKDRLYIFQFYPKQETSITYTNGFGQNRSLTSNTAGEIAIYEESGIASDISLHSGSGADVYLGTLYKDKLVSSEGNAGLQELYPVNAFKLRPAAKVNLHIKKPDGTPYTGRATYRGAVYKNGQIASASMESAGVTFTLDRQGRFALDLDPTQFWVNRSDEELRGSDRLEFLYEILFEDDYYPQLIQVDGMISVEDVARFGESVVLLREVTPTQRSKPFLASQVLDYHLGSGRKLDVMNYNGSIGPSDLYVDPDLVTTVAWWGQAKTGTYDVQIRDGHGDVLARQDVQTMVYPFATMAYSHNVTTLSEDVLRLGIGEKKKASVALYGESNLLLRSLESPFTFTNMVGAPSAADPSKGVGNAMRNLNDSGSIQFDPSAINTGDTVMGMALNLMNGKSIGGQNMSLLVTATEDPLVYRGLITLAQAFGNGGDTEINVGGVDDEEWNVIPSVGEIQDLVKKGTDGVMNEIEENARKTMSRGADYGVEVKGYFEVEARYDTTIGKWDMTVLGGGFDLNGVLGYTLSLNTFAGPIPITGEFALGAQANLAFRVYKPVGEVPVGIQAAAVEDYLTALRINLYVKAFGGLGFDYSIVALKIGVFGEINLTYAAEFLNRSYLPSPNDRIHAMNTSISGQVGIKFVAKLLFLSYEAVLASKSFHKDIWKSGNPEAIEAWKQQLGSASIATNGQAMSRMMFVPPEASGGYHVVSEGVSLEKRDYLDLYDRQWISPAKGRSFTAAGIGIMGAPIITDILTNAYPYANPLIARDGGLLVYLSDSNSTDVNKTRASWAIRSGAGFTNSGGLPMLSAEEYADNNLAFDGNSSFAVAAWEQQRMKLPDNSEALEWADMIAMMNSSEILASVYDGTNWATVRLTDNLAPDLAPVVAARGDQAFVAWRSVAGVHYSAGVIQYGDISDTIVYKTYNKLTQTWSPIHTLYNGGNGKVKGLQTAMLSDGTTAVVYTVDTGTRDSNPAYGYEIFVALVDGDGQLVSNLRLTNNYAIDQNPQIMAVNFGAEGEKFVLGWHQIVTDGVSDIRLAAMNRDGSLYDTFIHSISGIEQHSPVFINDSFRFVKGENVQLGELSMLWVEPSLAYNTTTENHVDRDILRAVHFIQDDHGRLSLTAPLEVATMDNYTVIDHYDAYATGPNAIQAVLLANAYTGAVQYQQGVYTVDAISSMKSVSTTYGNAIDITNVQVNYGELKNDFRTPFQFTVVNRGVAAIDSIHITLQPDGVAKTFDNLNVGSNRATILRMDYDVPVAATGIHDLQYVLRAEFKDGDTIEKNGTLHLDVPDLGIARLEKLNDGRAERHFMVTLNNLSDVPLVGNNNRKVYVGMYTSPTHSTESELEVREITGDDLQLLDDDALTMKFAYAVPPTGIPTGGIRIYIRVWVEERQQNGSYLEVAEYYQGNNMRSILYPNPIEANNGDPILIKLDQEGGPTGTTAHITVRNLSMHAVQDGNVLVQLLDANNQVVETNLLATTELDLLHLGGEEEANRSIAFQKTGNRIIAQYFTAQPQDMVAGISAITVQGIAMHFDKNRTEYALTSVNMTETTVTVVANSAVGLVEIRDGANGQVLASGRGIVTHRIALHEGAPPTHIQVAAIDESTQTDTTVYTLSILNNRSVNGGGTSGNNGNRSDSGEVGDAAYTVEDVGATTILSIAVQLVEGLVSEVSAGDGGSYAVGYIPVAGWDALIAKAKQLEATGRKVIIEVKASSPANSVFPREDIRIEFPKKALYRLAAHTSAELTVVTALTSVAFDAEAISSLGEGSIGEGLQLIMQMVSSPVLLPMAEQRIGKRPIVDITIMAGNRELSDLGDGKAVIRIPYTAKSDERAYAIVAYFVDRQGELHLLPGRYLESSRSLILTTDHFSRFAVGYNEKAFADVSDQAWYYEAIGFLAARNMVNGMGNGRFAPLTTISRADFLIMVMHAYGIELDEVVENNFADAGNTYYTPYLGTAKRLGLTNGIGNNQYAPGEYVTREDMSVIVYRILGRLEELPTSVGNQKIEDFEDRLQIASYAIKAIEQFVRSGVLSGDGKHIMPKGLATRAEAAQMVFNLLER